MLRFDLELKLLDGSLHVKDLPEAWRAEMSATLGLVPSDDRDGCLHDVHWFSGGIGAAFQSYTIGKFSVFSSVRPPAKLIRKFRARSKSAGFARCMNGSKATSSGMVANIGPTSS
jgi:Zn-dependent M32 family carboxypeptidase